MPYGGCGVGIPMFGRSVSLRVRQIPSRGLTKIGSHSGNGLCPYIHCYLEFGQAAETSGGFVDHLAWTTCQSSTHRPVSLKSQFTRNCGGNCARYVRLFIVISISDNLNGPIMLGETTGSALCLVGEVENE